MLLLKSLVLLGSTLSVLGVPSEPLRRGLGDHVIHEERSSLPRGWIKHESRLDKSRTIPIRINLIQGDIDEKGESLLMEVSHPESPKYGEHYSPHAVADLVS